KELPRLVEAALGGNSVDIPETADGEGIFRLTKVIRNNVPEDISAPFEMLLDLRNGSDHARILGVDKTKFRQKQQAGVHILAAESRHEAVELFIPALFHNLAVDELGGVVPVVCPFGQAQVPGNFGQPCTAGP